MSLLKGITNSWAFKIGLTGVFMGIPLYLLQVLSKPQINSLLNIFIVIILGIILISLGLIYYMIKQEGSDK